MRAEIVKQFGGARSGVTVGEIAKAVGPKLVRNASFLGYGGNRETVLADCRRALDTLRDEGRARFQGVKAQGKWFVFRRAVRAAEG